MKSNELELEWEQWVLVIQRHVRQEQLSGHVSPVDAAFWRRLTTWCEASALMPHRVSRQDVEQWSLDLRRHWRQEQLAGQVSPTDAAFYTRLLEFLERISKSLNLVK